MKKIILIVLIALIALSLGACMRTGNEENLSPIDLSTPEPVKAFIVNEPEQDTVAEQPESDPVDDESVQPLAITDEVEYLPESEELDIVPRSEDEAEADIVPRVIDGISPTTGLPFPTEEAAADLLDVLERMKERSGTIYENLQAKIAEASGLEETAEEPEAEAGGDSANPDANSAIDALGAAVPYLPVMVQIPNAGSARPQWNIQLADIVYETIIASGDYTRLTAIYHDNMPDHVGPVRSTRMMHWDIRQEWDIPYAYYGGQRKAGTSIYDYQKELGARQFWDGVNDTSGVFTRDSSRSAPDNAYVNIKDLMSRYSYEAVPRTFFFRDELPSIAEGEEKGIVIEPVTSFTIPYRKGDEVRYDWDSEAGYYLRFAGGSPFLDGTTMEQVHVTNIIVQKAKHSLYDNNAERMLVELIGEGDAEYFIGGYHFTGKWSREDVNSRTVYYDESGAEVALMPGITWIQMMRDTSEVTDIVFGQNETVE